jgi:hypothetical protein
MVTFTGMRAAVRAQQQSTSMYELVQNAYNVTLVGAFVPLVLGCILEAGQYAGRAACIGRAGHGNLADRSFVAPCDVSRPICWAWAASWWACWWAHWHPRCW